MPPAKSRKVLPSTSVRVAPVALSTKIGTTSVLARATTASLRAIQSREIGPGISVRIRIECSTCVSCVLERGRAPFDRHREPRARSPSHRTIRSGARGVDHGRLEWHRPCDRRGSRRRRPRHLDRVARSRAGRARGRPPDRRRPFRPDDRLRRRRVARGTTRPAATSSSTRRGSHTPSASARPRSRPSTRRSRSTSAPRSPSARRRCPSCARAAG